MKKKNIRCYLYTKDKLPTLSKNLFRETLNIYNRKTRHVLVLGSKNFGKGPWTLIEEKIIDLASNKKKDYLILVKLDDTKIGWAENIGYLEYKENWHEVLSDIVAIVKAGRKRRRRKCVLLFFLLGLLGTTIYITVNNKNPGIPFVEEKKTDSFPGTKKDHGANVTPIDAGTRQPGEERKNSHIITVTGLVMDENGNPLDSVLITLNNMIGYTSSGQYKMHFEKKIHSKIMNSISLELEFSKKGYNPEMVSLTKDISPDNMVLVIDKIVLKK